MKKPIKIGLCTGILCWIILSCIADNHPVGFVAENVIFATEQYAMQLNELTDRGENHIPRTIKSDGTMVYASTAGWDWTAGFYAGSLWYLYGLTGDEHWKSLAERYTALLEKVQYNKSTHDVGFIIGCSYLNGIRLGGEEQYKSIIVSAAQSLSTRFRPAAGVIQSWNVHSGWQAKRGWKCPVIIDNMMNLELLFEATRMSGDSTYYRIAVSHADKTLQNHFRSDGSSFHVVDYDGETGEVRSRCTAQGYSDESAWARGQAWAIYGYTMCYRYTQNLAYLKQAEKVCDFIFTHSNMPNDLVPYWDYDAINIPHEPRDVSAAAITASVLYELSGYTRKEQYRKTADLILKSLASPAYRSPLGMNGGFLLMHSVGSIPHGSEVDVPLVYADYYFLEALKRKRDMEK